MTRARRAVLAALLCAAGVPGVALAQRPAVSPALPAVWLRDTVITVWLFARPRVSLDSAAALATSAGASVRQRSRWLHAVSADAPTAALRALARDRAFRRLQPLGRWRTTLPAPAAGLVPLSPASHDTCPAGGDPVYGPSDWPLRRLNVRPLVDQGADATGVRIAILDTGFDTANPAFNGVTVAAQHDFVFGDSVVRNEAADVPGAHGHGTSVWSLLAGDVPGRLRGPARGAEYLLAKTEDVRFETRIEEDHFVAALEWADSLGADLVTASLGYLSFDNGFGYTPSQLNGDVAVTTVAVDSAAAGGLLVLSAAGNGGPGFRTLVTPADADSGLGIGAEDSAGVIAPFSSRGPTADGRFKPDLVAQGADVCAVVGNGMVRRVDGTSFATPLVAAVAALVRGLNPTIGGTALAAALRRHATNRAAPDSIRGWGRPDAAASALFPAGVTPLSPLAGDSLTTVSPTFAWTVGPTPPPPGTVTFRLRAGRDSAFGAPLLDTTMTVTTAAPARAFPAGTLWWRVDATVVGGPTATTGPVGPVTIPAWADLLTFDSPAGETTLDTQPVFRWRSPAVATPPGPFTYDIFVRRANVAVSTFAIGGLIDTFVPSPVPLERGVTYTWRLTVRAGTDSNVVASAGTFLVLDPNMPPATLLYQNFPNPFGDASRPTTCVWFDLALASLVELDVRDLRGRLVRTLVPGAVLPPGRYGRGAPGTATCDPQFLWDGRAADGRTVPPGVYLVRLEAAGGVQFKRVVFRGGWS